MWDRRGWSGSKAGTKTQTVRVLAVISCALEIKWLISQQVRAVNTGSNTTKEMEEDRKRGKQAETERGRERVEERPKR